VATVFSHAVAGFAISTFGNVPASRTRLFLAGALCAAAPDLDVVTVWLGVPWGHVLGHRGITHSPAFAAALAAVVTVTAFRGRGRLGLWLVLFVATASHGVLDAMTDGGSGVALLAPLDDTRYFLPWRPIPVSPIGVSRFFTRRGLDVMRGELGLIWLPAAVVALLGLARRGRRRGRA
jgi:inner membrane protein